jgi:hypothetical protein
MRPTFRRLEGTTALTVFLSVILIRGFLRNEEIPLVAALAGVAIAAGLAYQLWPGLDLIWAMKAPFTLTWPRLAAAAGAGLLLTLVIVLGGTQLGLDLDPWLVLAGLAITAWVASLGWKDPTIRWKSPW